MKRLASEIEFVSPRVISLRQDEEVGALEFEKLGVTLRLEQIGYRLDRERVAVHPFVAAAIKAEKGEEKWETVFKLLPLLRDYRQQGGVMKRTPGWLEKLVLSARLPGAILVAAQDPNLEPDEVVLPTRVRDRLSPKFVLVQRWPVIFPHSLLVMKPRFRADISSTVVLHPAVLEKLLFGDCDGDLIMVSSARSWEEEMSPSFWLKKMEIDPASYKEEMKFETEFENKPFKEPEEVIASQLSNKLNMGTVVSWQWQLLLALHQLDAEKELLRKALMVSGYIAQLVIDKHSGADGSFLIKPIQEEVLRLIEEEYGVDLRKEAEEVEKFLKKRKLGAGRAELGAFLRGLPAREMKDLTLLYFVMTMVPQEKENEVKREVLRRVKKGVAAFFGDAFKRLAKK